MSIFRCHKSRPPRPKPQVQYEYINVCIDSGKKVHVYCPLERIDFNKKFIKDKGPKDWCDFHKKPVPPPPIIIPPIEPPIEPPVEPPPPPVPDYKLEIKDGLLRYGDVVKFCGVSRREILMRAKGQVGGLSPDYTLEDYERDIINSGINYVRHIGVMDTPFLIDHCKRMEDARIIVEVEVYESDSNEMRVDIDSMGQFAGKNVLFDVGNEFLDRDAVDDVINICEKLKAQGCIVSAGAWGGSHYGEEHSKEFHGRYNGNHVNTHHRPWAASSFQETIALGKPVMWSEYFAMKANLSIDQVKSLMALAFHAGCQGIQYYGFRDAELRLPGLTSFDPFPYREILNYAGSLVK